MKKIILSISLLPFLIGCQSTISKSPSEEFASTFDAVSLSASNSMSSDYLREGVPLSSKYVESPFLFDGDVVLLDDFDFSAWRNKRFLKVEGRSFVSRDRYLIDMEYGEIRELGNRENGLEFKDLLQSLVIKLSPLKGLQGTPDFLMLTNMVEVDGETSILVIEDPKSLKIHGFIESAIVNAYF